MCVCARAHVYVSVIVNVRERVRERACPFVVAARDELGEVDDLFASTPVV